MLDEHEHERDREPPGEGGVKERVKASDRIVVTDYTETIHLTFYRDGNKLACVEQSTLQALMIAERLLDAALRRLIVDPETRVKFL